MAEASYHRSRGGGSLWESVIQLNHFEQTLVAEVGNNLTVNTATLYGNSLGPGYEEGQYNSNSGYNLPSLGSLSEMTFGGRIAVYGTNVTDIHMSFGAFVTTNYQLKNGTIEVFDSGGHSIVLSWPDNDEVNPSNNRFVTVSKTGAVKVYIHGTLHDSGNIPSYTGTLAELVGQQGYRRKHRTSEMIILNKAVSQSTIQHWDTFIATDPFTADNIDP